VTHRIALVIKYLAGVAGGAERVVVDLANALHQRGHRVRIFTQEKSTDRPFFPLLDGVEYENTAFSQPRIDATPRERAEEAERTARFRDDPAAMDWFQGSASMRLRWERAILGFGAEVAITFMPHTNTPVLQQLGRKLPVIVANQNSPAQDYFNPERHDPNPFDRWLRLESLDLATRIQVLVPGFVEELPEALRGRICVIPNCVWPPAGAPPPAAGARRIIAVGRLVPQKGFDLLLRAMATVARQHPDWRLSLFGSGPEEAALRRIVRHSFLQKHVLFHGTSADIRQEMAQASLFVIPSTYEGWGLTLTEAMGAGLPCIGFADCTGVNWLLQDPAVGRLVPERSAAALAQAIGRLIDDPAGRAAMGAQARDHVAQFAPGRVYGRWDEIIREIGGRRMSA
jgi:glycosyltransferase involved in cell wall biosynthesis